jgi:hypothetical protein
MGALCLTHTRDQHFPMDFLFCWQFVAIDCVPLPAYVLGSNLVRFACLLYDFTPLCTTIFSVLCPLGLVL